MSARPEVQIRARLLDRAHMAACIAVSEDSLDRMRKLGCPCVPVPGSSKVVFDPDDVIEWMKSHPAREAGPCGTSAIDVLDKALKR